MRFFYVASVPLLATLWLATLFFRREQQTETSREAEASLSEGYIGSVPRTHRSQSSRRTVVFATVLALVFAGATLWAFNFFVQNILQTPTLSPRPFVSHWVNILVFEPNDNSFPSPEAILLGVLWIATWATSCKWNILAFLIAFVGCFTRVFCGTHYVADVVVGLLWGASLCVLTMALCGVVLRLSPRPFRQRAWRLRVQGAIAFGVVLTLILLGVFSIRDTPRLLAKWQQRGEQTASDTLRHIEYSNRSSSQENHEGEGAQSESAQSFSGENTQDERGKTIPLPGVISTGGYLPAEEARLLRALQNAKLAHSLVSVDVAALRDKGFAMHCASVRFAIRHSSAWERRRVAQTAQRIVRIAFATDNILQSVDVVGVVLNNPTRDKVRYPIFTIGAIPVWTASVQRKDLVLENVAPWLNWPNADAGLWLRARSKIYINERVLPTKDAQNAKVDNVFLLSPNQTSSTQNAPRVLTTPPNSVASKANIKPPVSPTQNATPKATPFLNNATQSQTPKSQTATPKVVVPPSSKPAPQNKPQSLPTTSPAKPQIVKPQTTQSKSPRSKSPQLQTPQLQTPKPWTQVAPRPMKLFVKPQKQRLRRSNTQKIRRRVQARRTVRSTTRRYRTNEQRRRFYYRRGER